MKWSLELRESCKFWFLVPFTFWFCIFTQAFVYMEIHVNCTLLGILRDNLLVQIVAVFIIDETMHSRWFQRIRAFEFSGSNEAITQSSIPQRNRCLESLMLLRKMIIHFHFRLHMHCLIVFALARPWDMKFLANFGPSKNGNCFRKLEEKN